MRLLVDRRSASTMAAAAAAAGNLMDPPQHDELVVGTPLEDVTVGSATRADAGIVQIWLGTATGLFPTVAELISQDAVDGAFSMQDTVEPKSCTRSPSVRRTSASVTGRCGGRTLDTNRIARPWRFSQSDRGGIMTRDSRNGTGDGSLSKLLDKVRKAPPNERMHLRNEVAAHGAAALETLQPWLGNAALASFAIRALGQIGDLETNRAAVLERLRAVRPTVSADHQQDIDEVFARWGERATPLRARGVSTARKVDLTGEAPLEWGLRAQLVAAARERQLVTYAEAGEPLELSMRNPSHRPFLGKLLGVISEHELLAGRPTLSSIVVKKGETSPGSGFFLFGAEHGLVQTGEDEKTYCTRQIEATFGYWSSHTDPEASMVEGESAGGAESVAAEATEEVDEPVAVG